LNAPAKVPVCIVGLGRIASILEDDALREKPCTHAGAAAANPHCVLSGGYDSDAARRSLFARRWGVPVYDSFTLMLQSARPAILVVATPPDTHLFYCKTAADAGIGTIICEKPLADTLDGARRIAALPARTGVRIVVNHERRYSADYIKAKAILQSGGLGGLLGVRACIYMGKTRRLSSVLWDDGTHILDAVMFLTGRRLVHKTASGSPLAGRQGTAFLTGALECCKAVAPPCLSPDIGFMLEVGAGRDHLVFEIEASCEAGRLRIGNGIFQVSASAPCPYAEGFRSLGVREDGWDAPTGYFAGMFADAVSCARDPERRPVSAAADALAVVEYLAAVSG
jgi:predicted dehydrogenase